MIKVHPQYIKDTQGEKSMVILSVKEFDTIIELLEEIEDVRLYDDAIKNDTGERIPMEDVFNFIENKRKIV
jgi:hypothetical protein